MRKYAKTGCKIINISSVLFSIRFSTLICYTVARTGGIGFAPAMVDIFVDFNININDIAPGIVETGFSAHIDSQCIKRNQMPEDIVGPVIFLSSKDPDFITG